MLLSMVSQNSLLRLDDLSHHRVVLALYEFIITADDEVRVVWRRPWNMLSILFLLNRWIGMLGTSVVGVTPVTPEVSLSQLYAQRIDLTVD